MKSKKYSLIILILITCITLYVVFVRSVIDNHTWVLSYAQQAESPYFIVAHYNEYDLSDDKSSLFKFSKPIELICEAKNGKLVLTDKTNSKTYEGTYKKTRRGVYYQSYTVVIDGVEGTANISSNSPLTLFVSIGGYCLNFETK